MQIKPFIVHSYGQFLNEKKLMGSKCKKCGNLFSPPRPLCITCYSREMEWIELKGKGKLAAFTCISLGPMWMKKEGLWVDREHPYCCGVVELEEGVKIDARIEGVDPSRPETIKISMPVKVKFLHRGEGENLRTYLAFEPDKCDE